MKDKTLRTAEVFGCLSNLTFGATRGLVECMSMISSDKSAVIISNSCDDKNPTTNRRSLSKTSTSSRISTGDRRIVLNVSGRKFETWKSTLGKHPQTLLGSKTLEQFYDAEKKEYFIDRDPYLFKFVLGYYQNGNLHCSTEDCPEAFQEELKFYGLSVYDVDDCCWEICSPKEKNILVEDHEEGEILHCVGGTLGDLHCEPKRSLRQKIWRTIGPSKTTKTGVYFHIIYGFFIFVSVLVTTLETVQCNEVKTCGEEHETIFFAIDSVCVAIFTFEVGAEVFGMPSKGKILKRYYECNRCPGRVTVLRKFNSRTIWCGAEVSCCVESNSSDEDFKTHQKLTSSAVFVADTSSMLSWHLVFILPLFSSHHPLRYRDLLSGVYRGRAAVFEYPRVVLVHLRDLDDCWVSGSPFF